MKDGVISKVALNDEKNADIEAVNVPYINYAMKGMADSYIGTTGTAADTVSGVVISQTRIWYVLVSAIPMRMMCPLLHVLPNGLAAEAGNPLLDTGVIVPGMCLSIIWFVFVTVLFLKWFERREVK